MTATATLSKGVDLRAGVATTPIMKGERIEVVDSLSSFNASTVLKHLGGDFTVTKRPLLLASKGGTLTTDMFAVVEETDEGLRVHGSSVSNRYPLYQFTQFAEHVDETLDRLIETGLIPHADIEAAVLLRGGALMLYVIDLGLGFSVGGFDHVSQKYIAASGHGGESAIKNLLSQMRLYCLNQLPSFSGAFGRRDAIFYEQHTTAGVARANLAPKLAETALKSAKADGEIAEILASIPQGIADLERFLRDVAFSASTKQGEKGKETKVERVLSRFTSEPDNAWGAYNAIGWYEETKGDLAGASRQVTSLNRIVAGNHTPAAKKYVRFVLPDTVKRQYARN